jgi:hypothetical protein
LIPLSCNEIRRLWATLTHPTHPETHTDHWSHWRLLHQTRAKHSHYQRQQLKHHKVREGLLIFRIANPLGFVSDREGVRVSEASVVYS